MKRFYTLLVAVCAFFAASAQNPMVTLSHNGELSFFTNLTAFESAYSKAKPGDIIYLSEGEFAIGSGKLELEKRVSVVGSGHKSHILGKLIIKINDQSRVDSIMDAPLFDGVRIDEISFYNSSSCIANLNRYEIRRSWIGNLETGAACYKATYDDCIIENFTFYGSGYVTVKNSKLRGRNSQGLNDGLYGVDEAINCNISDIYYLPKTSVSCIIQSGKNGYPSGSCSIINSVVDFPINSSDIYTHDCYYYSNEEQTLFDEKMDCILNLEELGYFGQDGSIVGIQGGESPFSENPSVPTVDTEKSSVEYDAVNNKLKVSITVKAD